MKIILLTKKNNSGDELKSILGNEAEIIQVENEVELIKYERDKAVLIIDIDTLLDHGFSVATKIANNPGNCFLLIGMTTLNVDSRDSKFKFIFSSLSEVKERLEEVKLSYEKI